MRLRDRERTGHALTTPLCCVVLKVCDTVEHRLSMAA